MLCLGELYRACFVCCLYPSFGCVAFPCVCRSGPLVGWALSHFTATRGYKLVTFKVYDVVVFSQKLGMCLLMSAGIDAYGVIVITASHTVLALMTWLRLRPHRIPIVRQNALLLYTCVLGLQSYCLLAATRWSARSPTSSWRYGFNVFMFCYVVGCIVWCCASIVRCVVVMIRGPTVGPRKAAAMVKTQFSNGIWVSELDGYSSHTVVARRLSSLFVSTLFSDSRKLRVSSLVSPVVVQPHPTVISE